MPRFRYYFDALPDGAIAIYETAPSFAEADLCGWTVHQSLDMHDFGEHSQPTMSKKAFVSQFEFHIKGTKFQKWIRNRASEVKIDGTFIIPFRPASNKKPWSNFIIAGMMFIPELEIPKWHFEGRPKEAASLAFLAAQYLEADATNVYNHTNCAKLRHILMTGVK
jgi:hypothetical protein